MRRLSRGTDPAGKTLVGTRALLKAAAGVIAARSYDQTFSAGSAKRAGMLAVQPKPDGTKSRS